MIGKSAAASHQRAVKRVMKMDSGDGPQFYAKTGWTRDRGINLGWWVGFVELEAGHPVFFATRITQNRELKTDEFPAYRMEITKKALAILGLIK